MKIRFKIFAVIVSFASFYFALIPMLQQCTEHGSDCTIYQEMMLLTRPVIIVDWEDESGIAEWSGTPQDREKASLDEYLRLNQNFILSMIVFPCCIIGAIVMWDKRR
jgi:hypothetical protein